MSNIEVIAIISLALLAISLFTLVIALIPLLSQANRTLANLNETIKMLNEQIMPNVSELTSIVGKAKNFSAKVGDSTKTAFSALKVKLNNYFGGKKRIETFNLEEKNERTEGM